MKKLYALLLSLVMMFAFASTAMAADLAPGLYIQYGDAAPVKQDVTIQAGDTVYDVVVRAFGDKAVWTQGEPDKQYSPLPAGSKVEILKSLDGKGSVPYNSKNLDPYEYYDSSVDDQTLARVNAALLAKYPDSNGLGLWMGNGVGYSNDGPYMAYVGDDWTFTVNGSRPVDTTDPSIELYMNQTTIAAGDVIVLNYGETIEVWNYQE